jgi:hypothetical protein
MTVPYTFGSATTAIPLSNLDSNFASVITLGNTAVQLGNTITTLTGLTTISTSADVSIHGLTVGLGAGSVSTNTVVGASALFSNVSGAQNTAIGYTCLLNTSGSSNSAFGATALQQNLTGAYNTAIGSGVTATYAGALGSNTYGSCNTAVGTATLGSNTTASNNTAVGYQAGYTLVGGTTTNNTFVGMISGYTVSSGTDNAALGYGALASGGSSGGSASNNVAIGSSALKYNTASNNTAVGYQAGYTNITGKYNTFLGFSAGYTSNNLASVGSNTFVGALAGYAVTSGTNNNFFGGLDTTGGVAAGSAVTSGSKNTILGSYSGGGAPISGTGNNYIVLSDGDGNVRLYSDGSGNINVTAKIYGQASTGAILTLGVGTISYVTIDGGVGAFYPFADNTTSLGYSTKRWTTVYATTALINTSDATEKQQIADLTTAELATAKAIKSLIKSFKFNDAVNKKGNGARIHIGVIAQDVQKAFTDNGLDANKYGIFCSDTWYDVNGSATDENDAHYTASSPNAVQVTKLGVRYEELLAFVIASL